MKSSPSQVCVKTDIKKLLRAFSWCTLFAALMFLPIACGVRDHAYDPTHPLQPPVGAYLVPPGVVVPRGASLTSFKDAGLYPELGGNVDRCCFVAPSASMLLLKPSDARELQVIVFVPKWPSFMKRSQKISVAIGPMADRILPIGEVRSVKPGLHRLLWTLPVSLRGNSGLFYVRLNSAFSVVPTKEKVASDKRKLAFVLVAIRFT